ncbi:MAG: diadenosine tetraphosphatase [Ignavibacteriales bacterium]|nr:MAG: diadenosine tetraphosphatase [Ignavibacteriales bacterium]
MVAVIGDVHGCYFTLKELVSQIKDKYPDIEIYSVGDLVDRGNNNFEAVDFIINENIKFTAGNHDFMFYHFIHHPGSELGRIWIYNGSETTVNSYSNKVNEMYKHLEIIIKAPLFFDLPDCFICHAGISSYFKSRLPRKVLENIDQVDKVMRLNLMNEHGILWTRDTLLNIGKLQIVGHTRQQDVVYHKINNVAYIDTSAYSGNKLSAVIVNQNNIIEIFSVPTDSRDIA